MLDLLLADVSGGICILECPLVFNDFGLLLGSNTPALTPTLTNADLCFSLAVGKIGTNIIESG